MHVQRGRVHWAAAMDDRADAVLAELKRRGLRMTPQRRAIVAEVMSTEGHINAVDIAKRVKERVPGVNASTVYRTLDTLETIGVLSHAHLEDGAEYHRVEEGLHVHLICADCGAEDALSVDEADSLREAVAHHNGFRPDLTHFAISGRCAACAAAAGRAS
jgi:Fur family transcriptional regulator, ferric uptake regulator